MASLTIKIPDSARKLLEKQAELSGRSIPAVVRERIETSQRDRDSSDTKPSLHERTRDLCGCFDSGVVDHTSNPKHLDGFGE